MPDPAVQALRVYRDQTLSADEKKRRLEAMIAHAPEPERPALSFDDYDDVGVLAPVQQRAPNRAMVQGTEYQEGKPARDAGAYERWATERRNETSRSPANFYRRRVEDGEAREAAKDPRAGSALGTATRRATTGIVDTALLPYRGARALSGGRLPELSAADAYAQAESLVRDEGVAATRERQRVQDTAHPRARDIGDAAAQVADPFLAAEAMKGGLKLRAMGGARGTAPLGPRGEAGFAEWRANKVESTAEKVLGTPRPDAHKILGEPSFGDGAEARLGRDGGLELTTKSGHNGQVTRTFRRGERGELIAENNYLEVPEAMREQGVGRELTRRQLAEYDRLGVDRVEMGADYDGRYVWPHLGYQVDKPTLKRLNDEFNRHLAEVGEEPIKASKIQDISEHPEGKDFLLDGYTEPFPMHLDMRSKEAEALRGRLGVGGRGLLYDERGGVRARSSDPLKPESEIIGRAARERERQVAFDASRAARDERVANGTATAADLRTFQASKEIAEEEAEEAARLAQYGWRRTAEMPRKDLVSERDALKARGRKAINADERERLDDLDGALSSYNDARDVYREESHWAKRKRAREKAAKSAKAKE